MHKMLVFRVSALLMILDCILAKAETFTHGESIIDRDEVDMWTNAIYLPRPRNPIPHDGHVLKFSFYARHTGTIYMQIWRKTGRVQVYELISSDKVDVTTTGPQTVEPSKNILVRRGDILGFYFPDNAIIPFDGRECRSDRTFFKRNPSTTDVAVGANVRFYWQRAGWNPCRKYSLSVTISSDIFTHGHSTVDRDEVDSWTNAIYLPGTGSRIPRDGHVLQFDFYARRTGTIYMQIWRKTERAHVYELVNSEKVNVNTTGLQRVEPRSDVMVQKGDLLGFYFPGNAIIPFEGRECWGDRTYYKRDPATSDVIVGAKVRFYSQLAGWRPCRKYSISVIISSGLNDTSSGPATISPTSTDISSETITTDTFTHGQPIIDRDELDSWTNAIYIPGPRSPITREGHVTRFNFYARQTGTIYMQIWRKTGSEHLYELVSSDRVNVNTTGPQGVEPNRDIMVQQGDLLGFYFPGKAIIPFEGRECWGDRTYYRRDPSMSDVTIGAVVRFYRKLATWSPCRKYSVSVTIKEFLDTFTHGQPIVNRGELDSWSDAIYLPGPSSPIPRDGRVVKFNFYARQKGTIYMQIWRKTDNAHVYELVSSDVATVTSTGSQTIEPKSDVTVQKGDLLGFYFPGNAIIPFEGRECWSDRTYYKRNPSSSDVKVGAKVRFSLQEAGWNPCRKYSLSVTISTVTGIPVTHGFDPVYRSSLDEWSNAMYILTPNTPLGVSGKVISWELYANKPGPIYLQMFEKVSGYQRYKLVGQTRYYVNRTGSQTVKVDSDQQFSVQENNLLGFYFPDNSIIPFTGSSCSSNRVLYKRNPGRVSVGSTFTFSQKQSGWRPCRKYSVQVTVLANVKGTVHGDAPTNRAALDNWRNAMYILNPTKPIPTSGTVTSWEMFARRKGTIYLQVFRKVSGYNRYKIVGQTRHVVTDTGVQRVTVPSSSPITVAKGDLVGFYFPSSSIIPFDGTEGCSSGRSLYKKSPYGVRVGAIFTFSVKQAGWKPCRKYSLRLTVNSSGTDEEEGSGDDEGSTSSETIILDRR